MLSSNSRATNAPGLSCARQGPCSSLMKSKPCMACPSSRGSPLSVRTDWLVSPNAPYQEPSLLHLLGRARKNGERPTLGARPLTVTHGYTPEMLRDVTGAIARPEERVVTLGLRLGYCDVRGRGSIQ